MDGQWLGWVGGSCAEPVARKAARAAMADGRCRLIQLSNDTSEPPRAGLERVPMSCYSGGTLELYVEPHLPEPELVVFGASPVAREVARLGAFLHYRVTCVVPLEAEAEGEAAGLEGVARAGEASEVELSEPSRAFVVVAGHGRGELTALRWASERDVAYVGLVASARRASSVRERLEEQGVGSEFARGIDAPAGVDLQAKTPQEIALSVLAGIVRRRRSATADAGGAPGERDEASVATSLHSTPPVAPSASFAAVVLAAGLSSRMGDRNKLLLPVSGQPLIRRTVASVLQGGFSEVVVVLGHQAEEVERALSSLGVRTVYNPDFGRGQVSSVRAGLAALRPVDAVAVCLGDQPLLTPSDLSRLRSAYAERAAGDVLVPTHGGVRGNPVVLSWQATRETLEGGANFGCRQLMDEHAHRVSFWDSQCERFVRDVDRPSDYDRLGAGP